MKIQRKDALKTRERLLAAASDVFAEKGYENTTIAEICKRAKTNIAAVNYHFGDKGTLYKEAWRYCFYKSIKAYPPNGGVSRSAPPEKRLRGQVVALLRRIADKKNKEFLIVQKELVNPTGLLDEVIREELRPLHEKMETLVHNLLGPCAHDREVKFCTISIVSQCINPLVGRKQREEGRGDEFSPPLIEDIEAYSKHVVKFSLGGIKAIREGIEKKRRCLRN